MPVASYTVAEAGIMARPFTTDNTTGGVLVMDVTGTLTLNGNITADAAGFAGGDTIGAIGSTNNLTGRIQWACCGQTAAGGDLMDATNRQRFFFAFDPTDGRCAGGACGTISSKCSDVNNTIGKGARKGFGIFGRYSNQELSMGKFANAGGGGHGYNTGGGGGGFGAGGRGGWENPWACNASRDWGGLWGNRP